MLSLLLVNTIFYSLRDGFSVSGSLLPELFFAATFLHKHLEDQFAFRQSLGQSSPDELVYPKSAISCKHGENHLLGFVARATLVVVNSIRVRFFSDGSTLSHQWY
jgi:hypothetical protein